MNVIDFIRNKVSECGSQSAVARKCGISQALVNKMMHDHYDVQINTIMKIASAYGIAFASFFKDGPPEYVGQTAIHEAQTDRRFPLVSNVNGGHGAGVCWENSGNDYITGPADLTDPGAFAMRVVGDSMAPKYTDGMIVYASPAAEITNGCFVVAQLDNGERMVKRYRRTNGTIILESLNPTIEPLILDQYEIKKMARVTHSKEKA